MSKLLAVLFAVTVLAVVVAAKRPTHRELDHYTFDKYIRDFRKGHIAGTHEYGMRKALFDTELNVVRAHNADKTKTWKKGVNMFSDWTLAEKRTRLYGFNFGVYQRAETKPQRVHRVGSMANVPNSVDYRLTVPAILTAVKDQGMCGSCWAHAATETIETAWAQATGQLYVLSQQQITSCTPNPDECGGTGGCFGAIAELAIDFVTSAGGIVQEWSDPYLSYYGTTPKCSYWQNLTVVRTTGYTSVSHNDASAVKHALATAGPLAVSVDASEWSNYEGGIYSGCDYSKNISMDHAVQAVGYGTDFDTGLDYWIIRNSWSPGWGEHGFIRLLRSKTGESCGWNVNPQNGNGCKGQTAPQWACGMCGVAFDTLYANADTPSN